MNNPPDVIKALRTIKAKLYHLVTPEEKLNLIRLGLVAGSASKPYITDMGDEILKIMNILQR